MRPGQGNGSALGGAGRGSGRPNLGANRVDARTPVRPPNAGGGQATRPSTGADGRGRPRSGTMTKGIKTGRPDARHPGRDGRGGKGDHGGHGDHGGRGGHGGHGGDVHINNYYDHSDHYYNYNHYYGHYVGGHYRHHRYGYHPYHHGKSFHHRGLSWGLWIGFRGSSWYYCPTYRTTSYVYVSPVYSGHYYYGAGSGSNADRSVEAVDRGWRALERGNPSQARREFARASSLTPSWGLPRVGYAIALSASGYHRSAAPQIRRALSEDPYALLEVPWTETLGSLLVELDSHFTTLAYNGVAERDSWLMAGAMRVLLGDADAASEAAFNAEAAGEQSGAITGLFEVIGSYEAPPEADVYEIVE